MIATVLAVIRGILAHVRMKTDFAPNREPQAQFEVFSDTPRLTRTAKQKTEKRRKVIWRPNTCCGGSFAWLRTCPRPDNKFWFTRASERVQYTTSKDSEQE